MYTGGQLDGGTLIWVLSLTLRGKVYRYSEAAAEVLDGATPLLIREGLLSGVEVEDRLALPGESPPEPSQEVSLIFASDDAEGWAVLAAGDLDLGDASGELALLLLGEDWSTREICRSGPVEAASYGALHEPVQLRISEAPWTRTSTLIPRDSEIVSPSTWPRSSSPGYSVDEGVEGVFYPEVIGAPGYRHPRAVANSYPSVPVALVEVISPSNAAGAYVGLLGRGRLSCVGVANSVHVRNLTTAGSANITPAVATDELGQTVTVISISNATLPVSPGDELWASFLTPATGGRPSPYSSGTLRRAGEVIAYLLQESGARVDASSLPALQAWLAPYALDFHINEQVDPLDVVLDDLLPLFPVALHLGADGLSLLPWRYNATAADAIVHIDIDFEGGERDGQVSRSPASEVVNHLGIEYAWHGGNRDSLQGRIVYLPSKRFSDDEQETNPYARQSYTRYGERSAEPITTELVVDSATARGILDWQIRWRSQTRETVRYRLGQPWQVLRPGQVVLLSGAEIGWARRICIVVAVLRAPGDTVVEFVTVPDWVRDGSA